MEYPLEDDLLEYRLPIDQQITVVEYIQQKFMDVDKRWNHLADYDGSYGTMASALEHVRDTLLSAKVREEIEYGDRETW